MVAKVYGVIGPNDYFELYRDFVNGQDSVFMGHTYTIAYRQPLCQCTCVQPGYLPQSNQNPFVLGGIREDSGKVYFTKFGSDGSAYFKPFRDTLLFDFTAQPGDTLVYEDGIKLAFTGVETLSDGRKKVLFKLLPIGYPRAWIEGQGCEGLLETTRWFNMNFNGCCFSNGLPSTCTVPCNVTTGLPAIETIDGLEIFPSPATDRVTVTLPEGWTSADCWFFSSDGALISTQTNLTTGSSVDLTMAPPGMVAVYVVGSDGRQGIVRIVKM
jgi:hypothetical protein